MPAKRGVVQCRVRGNMGASENSYRLYNCARCAKQVRICCKCDRGNRYCAEGCARERRRESLRRAGRRYQQSHRGACKHAARQRAWRERRAQKVTHQGSLGRIASFIVALIPTKARGESDADTGADVAQLHTAVLCAHARGPIHYRVLAPPRCSFCGGVLSAFARLGALRARS